MLMENIFFITMFYVAATPYTVLCKKKTHVQNSQKKITSIRKYRERPSLVVGIIILRIHNLSECLIEKRDLNQTILG